MELRTTFKIEQFPFKITYNDPVLFIGSCFASEIGSLFQKGKMPVVINPAGTVYNPVSVSNTLDIILSDKKFTNDDLLFYNGNWLSLLHYTDFSSDNSETVLEMINRKSEETLKFLHGAKHIFITFGTARVYRFKETGSIVSNCNKIPSERFIHELLTVDDIVNIWTLQLDRLQSLLPGINVVFTISPIRHWKDGPHGNQVSKSVLFLSVEELLKHSIKPSYFPAYELIMDDLRDYRFYSDDMLHLSPAAINYVWEKFSESCIDKKSILLWNEIVKINKAMNHRFNSSSEINRTRFAEQMIIEISEIEKKIASVDFSEEKEYFRNLRDM
jgi:hypothetical protein